MQRIKMYKDRKQIKKEPKKVYIYRDTTGEYYYSFSRKNDKLISETSGVDIAFATVSKLNKGISW